MNYAATASRVSTLLGKYGTTITYTRPGTPTNNLVAGTSTPGTPTVTANVPALVLQASKGSIEAFDNRRESESLKGAELRYLKIAAAALSVVPKSDDKVSFAGKDWLVLGCTPVDLTGSDPLVYGCGVMAL